MKRTKKTPAAILTDASGHPITRPRRVDFAEGVEGDIEFLNAFHAYHDKIAGIANAAFDDGFRRGLR